MNERIKELAEQAGYSWHNSFSGPILSETATEKFAKLIVLRCAEISDTAEPFISSDLIKQHFGVTE